MLTTRYTINLATLGLSACLFNPLPAQAGPLDVSRLPAETRWVMHIDVEGLMTSRIGHAMAQESRNLPLIIEDDTVWGKLSREIEFDLTKDLKSLTLTNAGEIPADTVILVVTDEKIERIFEMLPELMPSHRVATMNGHEVHSWTEIVEQRRDRWHAHVRPGPAADQRLVLLSQNWEQLLDVIDLPTKPAGAVRPLGLPALPGRGSLVFVAANDLSSLDDDGAEWLSGAADVVKSLAMDLREHEGIILLHAVIMSHGEEEATSLAQMLQGMVAMGRLALANQPEAERARALLAQVAILPEGEMIRISLSVPVEAAIQSMSESGAFGQLQLRQRSLDLGAGVRSKHAPDKDDGGAAEKSRK